jgi:hypothetical protein
MELDDAQIARFTVATKVYGTAIERQVA